MTTLYRGGTSSTSPELNPDFKIIQNQSGNVVAVPPDVHGGHGGEGEQVAGVRSELIRITITVTVTLQCKVTVTVVVIVSLCKF